jgi:hypothetical protein
MDAQVGKVSRYVLFLHMTSGRLALRPLTHSITFRTRHLPKPVHQASKLKRTMLDARRVKEERRRKHTRAGETKPKAERKGVVLAEQK